MQLYQIIALAQREIDGLLTAHLTQDSRLIEIGKVS
jgi:hypothetical protein